MSRYLQSQNDWEKFRTIGEERGDRNKPKEGRLTLFVLIVAFTLIGQFMGILFAAAALGPLAIPLLIYCAFRGSFFAVKWVVEAWRESGK